MQGGHTLKAFKAFMDDDFVAMDRVEGESGRKEPADTKPEQLCVHDAVHQGCLT